MLVIVVFKWNTTVWDRGRARSKGQSRKLYRILWQTTTQCNNQSKECWQYIVTIWESRGKKYTFLCHLQDPKKFHRRLLGIFIQTKPVFMASALKRIPGLTVELKILSKIYFNIYLCICLHECMYVHHNCAWCPGDRKVLNTQELQLHTDG